MSLKTHEQLFILKNEDMPSKAKLIAKRTGTFIDNMNLPIHRWFRYPAGFSSEWVEKEIAKVFELHNGMLLDPFVGSGTTVLAAEKIGMPSIGLESHPFIGKIAQAKLAWYTDKKLLLDTVGSVVEKSRQSWKNLVIENCPELLKRCYTEENLKKLEAIRICFSQSNIEQDDVKSLVWLAVNSILRECSSAGTAQWQYLLPNKTKKNVKDPIDALLQKAFLIAADMGHAEKNKYKKNGKIINCDARNMEVVADRSISLVITSPPYPNNYDYADATRLELTYWREITGWGDLHEQVRKYLLTSCSQHSAKERLVLEELLQHEILKPIKSDIKEACFQLSEIRKNKGGKKTYHTMIAAYFIDLGLIWRNLRRVCKEDAKVCFVVGDSAPYGVYVPVDIWLGELALAAGFKSYNFDKIRDRNVKWKNRKHGVPLKEGHLWVLG